MANEIYVYLYHGRKDPEEQMEDWGFDGPTIGPFETLQVTYAGHFKLHTEDDWVCDVQFHGELVQYGDNFYGDMIIAGSPAEGVEVTPPVECAWYLEEERKAEEAKRLREFNATYSLLMHEHGSYDNRVLLTRDEMPVGGFEVKLDEENEYAPGLYAEVSNGDLLWYGFFGEKTQAENASKALAGLLNPEKNRAEA